MHPDQIISAQDHYADCQYSTCGPTYVFQQSAEALGPSHSDCTTTQLPFGPTARGLLAPLLALLGGTADRVSICGRKCIY